MGHVTYLDYAMQTLRHKCYGRFLAHHLIVCHGCESKDACRIESTQRIFTR
jgi:hypothetical protein